MSFSELINGDKPVLVDFTAVWCGPCKMMAPILEEVKHKVGDKATIIKVDVDKNPGAAEAYQVKGVPTFIILKKGQIKWRETGVTTAADLERALQNNY
jgi:thioredoxin 1